jgi:putative ABC transport system permease protein
MAPESLLTMRMNLPESRYADSTARTQFYENVLRRLEAIPNARSVALATNVPYAGAETDLPVTLENAPPARAGDRPVALVETVSSGYFRTLNIPLRQGREFARWDSADAPPAAIVTASFARRHWEGESPLGKRLKIGPPESPSPWIRVIGVVDDVRYTWLQREIPSAIYLPHTQAPRPATYVVLRAKGDPVQLIGSVGREIAAVDPNQRLSDISTLEHVISNSVIGLSYVAVMLTVLGGIALLLASVGVFGLMSYMVSRQTQEIGLRMALGAEPRTIVGMVVRRGVILAGAGLLIGLAFSVVLARLMSGLIFGVKPFDAAAFGGATLLLSLMALLASYLPARKAIGVDPAITLRFQQ